MPERQIHISFPLYAHLGAIKFILVKGGGGEGGGCGGVGVVENVEVEKVEGDILCLISLQVAHIIRNSQSTSTLSVSPNSFHTFSLRSIPA
jgi:hypothetical protein